MALAQPDSAQINEDYGRRLGPGERNPAPYQAASGPYRGRLHAETECTTRSPFQRDRDRVLHSTAFRRLTHKTQVFIYHEGDHYRSRLTHSLEVAQVARTIARQLRLNEDLAECLSLAHDLGHPPFGHAGERALDTAMAGHDGFDHNAQSLRIVMKLEKKYAAFDGLNLTWEVLEGLAKHNGPVTDPESPIAEVMRELAGWRDFDLNRQPSAEAQVAALSDDIAYLTHDLDDGLRAGLIALDDLRDIPLIADHVHAIAAVTHRDPIEWPYEIVRHLIAALIKDMVDQSRARLAALAPANPDDIRTADEAVIGFSDQTAIQIAKLREFLFTHVYRSPRVMTIMTNAEQIVRDLFDHYAAPGGSGDLPEAWQKAERGLAQHQRLRLIADYLAGMTDRFAIAEHVRLFDATPELS